MAKSITKEPKNILVLQQRQLGDVVVTTPVFAHIKQKFPHAKLTFFTEERSFPLVQHDPNIDEFILLDKKKNFWQQVQFYFGIRQKKFDVVVDLQQLPRCQIVTLVSGAEYKLSFSPRHDYRKFLYTHCDVPENTEDYTSFSKCRMLSPLGIEPQCMKPQLYLLDEERQEAKQILKSIGIEENTPFITLDATHKHPRRRWKYYAELVQELLKKLPDYKIFVLRAPNEDEQVLHLLKIDPQRVVMPKNPLPLRLSMACMEKACYHIGNTSAPQHIALGLNVPTLVILAETASFWHYNPKNPPKGTAKQKEVRVISSVYETYLQEEKAHSEGNNPHFVAEEFPKINLITVEQALNAFFELMASPYYE